MSPADHGKMQKSAAAQEVAFSYVQYGAIPQGHFHRDFMISSHSEGRLASNAVYVGKTVVSANWVGGGIGDVDLPLSEFREFAGHAD